jgi:hypothetical protein
MTGELLRACAETESLAITTDLLVLDRIRCVDRLIVVPVLFLLGIYTLCGGDRPGSRASRCCYFFTILEKGR